MSRVHDWSWVRQFALVYAVQPAGMPTVPQVFMSAAVKDVPRFSFSDATDAAVTEAAL